jgi:HAD superfamily hydrolase (TIGR01509 family)
MICALLWDVDGTLAETEAAGHRLAFNEAFESIGMAWRWDVPRYGELLRITGGFERLLHDMGTHGDAPGSADERETLARELHRRKNIAYGKLLDSQGIALREGVRELLDECRSRKVRLGIVTTTSRVNVEALLGKQLGAAWKTWFATVVCGEDVKAKKPSPEAYQLALRELELGPLECVAMEDSPGGVLSARQADVPVIVTRSVYFANVTFEGAIAIGPGLHQREGWNPPCAPATSAGAKRITLDDIQDWHARMEFVSAHGD